MTREHQFDMAGQLLANRCEKHCTELIDFFCKDHEELCCKTCATSNHSTCSGRVTLSAAMQDDVNKELSHKFFHEIDSLKVNIEKHTISKSADRQRLDTELEQSRKRVTEYRERLNDELDRLQREFEKTLQNRYNTDVSSVENDIKTSEDMTTELNTVIRKLHSNEDNNLNCFIGAIRAKAMVKEFNEKLNNLSLDTWKKCLVYKIDPLIEQTVKATKSFGTFERRGDQVKVTEETLSNSYYKAADTNVPESNKFAITEEHSDNNDKHSWEIKDDDKDKGPIKINQYRMKLPHVSDDVMKGTEYTETAEKRAEKGDNIRHRIYEHAGIIEGMALTENGQLILADSFNKSLKVSHIKEPIDVQTIPLRGSPRDICVINEHTLCISYKESHEVNIVTLYEKHLETLHNVPIGKVCLGVFYKQGKLYVTCGQGNKAEIRLYLIDESIAHVRFCCKFPRGKKLFVSPCCVNTSNDGYEIYVGDYQEGIKALQRDGTQIWTNNGEKILKGVWGMAVDDNGDIYVTGHRTNNVVKISADGTMCGTVIDSIERPTAICYDGLTRTLLIVYDTNQLLLYKIAKRKA